MGRSEFSGAARGFTLVEMLTVIAVIGILAAIIIPTVGNIREKAQKSAAASNLRQVAIAYKTYSEGSGRPRSINASSIYDWARIIAQYTNLNDAQIYVLNEDPEVEAQSGTVPRVIATPPASGTGNWAVTSDFQGFPISFAVANKLSSRAPGSTPVAWTRGLGTDGTWASLESNAPGVYGSEGGHVAFLDGHVTFYENLSNDGGMLMNYTSKQPTANMSDALSPGAEGLDYRGTAF